MSDRTVMVGARIPVELFEEFERIREERKISKTHIIKDAIADYIASQRIWERSIKQVRGSAKPKAV